MGLCKMLAAQERDTGTIPAIGRELGVVKWGEGEAKESEWEVKGGGKEPKFSCSSCAASIMYCLL